MDNRKKSMRILAIGLFIMSGSELIRALKIGTLSENEGDFKGLGIALILWATYRMRKPKITC